MEPVERRTGFSGSSPPASSSSADSELRGNDTRRRHRTQPHRAPASPPPGDRAAFVKEEPPEEEEEGVGVTEWRAFYPQPPLVTVIDDPALYESYKLPPLAKFGKGLVGRLPALWSVAVSSPEEVGVSRAEEEEEPVQYQRGETVIVQGPVDHTHDDEEEEVEEGRGQEEEPGRGLPPPPAAIQVRREEEEAEPTGEGPPEATPLEVYAAAEFAPFEEHLGTGHYSVLTNVVVTAPPPHYTATPPAPPTQGIYAVAAADYYRELYGSSSGAASGSGSNNVVAEQYAAAVRQHLAAFPEAADAFLRGGYKPLPPTAESLPSPDSGIGEAAATPRDHALHQIFDYSEMAQPLLQGEAGQGADTGSSSPPAPRKPTWSQEFARNPDADKVHIPKIFSDVGFQYHLESPISTSQRREDDRMTYINKGQYYGITLEHLTDPERPLRSCTVKSTVMLVFREEKSPEEELKAWKFWHGRQHSVKQRILDADTKNSSGIVGQIEEVTHNAIAFYWNPMEGPAKISVSVHCLSTDFSNQKGVKGLPLHLQVDTTDDLREGAPLLHRGYCQVKVFCDKGAERKTRDEERRAAKRKLTATGNSRKKMEEMYHPPCERSEFYAMSDIVKPPVLFTPEEDVDKCNGPELTFYAIAAAAAVPPPPPEDNTSSLGEEEKIPIDSIQPAKKFKMSPAERELTVSYWDSVLLYAKQADEEVFHPLHLIPPSLSGLAKALEAKYSINSELIRNLYKRCKKGVTVEMDDDIVRHYCNEDTFLVDIAKTEDDKFDVTLVEL